MRRVASSIGMRRSSSFFWTPAAHHDFECAIGTLMARGTEVTAPAIIAHMGHHHTTSDLKLADVEKHLRKKMLVVQRVMQQLVADRPGAEAPSAAGGSSTAAGAAALSSFRTAPIDRRAMPGATMAAVAEEPTAAAQGYAGANAFTPASAVVTPEGLHAAHPTSAAAAAAAAAAAISDGLAQRMQAQRMQHMQMSAAREALVASFETGEQPVVS